MEGGSKVGSEIPADKELVLEASSFWPDRSEFITDEFKGNEASITSECALFTDCEEEA